jgi:sarcosine oxidase subunit gamma
MEDASMADMAQRITPLAGQHGGSVVASLTPAEPASRISLRAGAEAVSALSKALGVDLPTKPKTSASGKGRSALWLGPDEWLIIGPEGDDLKALAAKSKALHSATDISHRNTAILVSGKKAAEAINCACPQDLSLSAFPVGACSRTVFGKIEVVLFRTSADTFRVECWRSFSTYAFEMLKHGAEDAAL